MLRSQNENSTTALVLSGENLTWVPRRRGYFRCGWRSVRSSCLPLLSLFLSVFSRRGALRRALRRGGRKRLASSGKRCASFSRAPEHATTRAAACGPRWHTVANASGESVRRDSFKGKISQNSNDCATAKTTIASSGEVFSLRSFYGQLDVREDGIISRENCPENLSAANGRGSSR